MHGLPRPSSDIFSLGILGIQALTGVPPTDFNVNAQTGDILWPERVSVSDNFAAILKKMTHFNFKNRYQSVSKVLEDFRNLL